MASRRGYLYFWTFEEARTCRLIPGNSKPLQGTCLNNKLTWTDLSYFNEHPWTQTADRWQVYSGTTNHSMIFSQSSMKRDEGSCGHQSPVPWFEEVMFGQIEHSSYDLSLPGQTLGQAYRCKLLPKSRCQVQGSGSLCQASGRAHTHTRDMNENYLGVPEGNQLEPIVMLCMVQQWCGYNCKIMISTGKDHSSCPRKPLQTIQ